MDSRNEGYLQKCSLTFFLLAAAIAIVGPSSKVLAQRGLIAERFSKVIPGVSTRDDVEKIFPITRTEEFKNDHSIDFHVGELSIGVVYSTGKCGDWLPDYGRFPKGTVVGISYAWRNDDRVLLKDVISDRSKFAKKQKSDVIVHVNYINEEWGVDVVYDTKARSVIDIFWKPGVEFKKYECP